MVKRFIYIIIAVFFYMTYSFGQQNDNSPYSRYGIGDLTDRNFNHLRQMGGLGSSFIDVYHINIVNPASLGFINATAFDFGVNGKGTILNDDNYKNTVWTGGLDYISLAFPLKNPINAVYDGVKKSHKYTMGLTLMPHSFVNYSISGIDSISTDKPFKRNYTGNGGTYKIMWTNAFKYKNFSIGANLGYVFGNLKYQRDIIFDKSEYGYSDFYTNDYNVRGFIWNGGLMYSDILNKTELEENKNKPVKRISAGINFNTASSITTSSNIYHRLAQEFFQIKLTDTIEFGSGIKGKGKLPAELGVGATYYYGERMAIGVNFSTEFWSAYYNEASGEDKGSLKDATKIAIGGYFRPDYKSFESYFKRVYYRYGAYYGTDSRLIKGEKINDFGVTFGLGMPFVYQRKVSNVNLGLNLGSRGLNSPISEKYMKISVGVSFNDDEWFLKRKYN